MLALKIEQGIVTIAMKCNYQGRLSITEDKPMTVDEFSKIMGKSYEKMKKIIGKFLELEMIILENEVYKIKNWNEYQSIQTYEKYKEQGRLRQQKYREKKKSENEYHAGVIKLTANFPCVSIWMLN